MPNREQLRNRLIKKLEELFQLNQPDLDFGFYRIMHAKAKQVKDFIENDLLKTVEGTIGAIDDDKKAAAEAEYEAAIKTAKKYGAPDPESAPAVKEAKVRYESVLQNVTSEAEIYDHLYRFFERYYDTGDFLSRRYFTRETENKAAPFAIPYNGEEVKLHWANADQYYIKTDEHFTNFSFDLHQAKEVLEMGGELFSKIDNEDTAAPLRVHFRIIDASEGEHGNIKTNNDEKRFFIIHMALPVELNDNNELVINFEYRADPDKSGQDATWRKKKNEEAIEIILKDLEEKAVNNVRIKEYYQLLKQPSPTESDRNRLLIARYLNKYTARNTMDYFIHKDLGSFLKRELDFYIKNEVMRLDDIQNADVPAVESYLEKIKALRTIALKFIEFLAQLENFQKKLWLKKKFVIETNYCITLDRVPEEFYLEIAANEDQHDEWVALFAINEIEEGVGVPGYSRPLSIEFLTANDKLVLDTRFFDESFKAKLLAAIDNFDEKCDGLLVHSENFQAMNLLLATYNSRAKAIYIDPPYNTGQDDFLYKDNYQSSSWLSMIKDRLLLSKLFLTPDGSIAISIDENELNSMLSLLDSIFGKSNRAGIATVKRGSVTGHKAINKGIVNITEYLVLYAINKTSWEPNKAYKARDRNIRYNNYIVNVDEKPDNWRIKSLLDVFSEHIKIPKSKLRKELGDKNFEDQLYYFVKMNSGSVIQLAYPDQEGVSKEAKEVINESKKNKDLVVHFEREGVPDMYLIGGQRILFYKDRLLEIDGELVTVETLSDIWDDILPNDLHNEGGISLKKGKKPEKLIGRIYDICCKNEDLILDYFLGSGTSSAVALKRRLYFIGIEISDYFDSKALMRVKLVNKTKKKHESDISFSVKYLRLESYEDTLNNLRFDEDLTRNEALTSNKTLREDYMLHYLLDVETKGSQSLLNIERFQDPTNYNMKIKKPGSDEYVNRNVDLIETFNYLIGLRVNHIAEAQQFNAEFKREVDPDLPYDINTKLIIDGGIKKVADGSWWFRKVEGWLPADINNPKNGKREKVLIVWRKLTGDIEQDNLVLEEWFAKNRISTRDFEFDLIYVNGSNNLPNLAQAEDTWKVRLIDEEFMKRMWEGC